MNFELVGVYYKPSLFYVRRLVSLGVRGVTNKSVAILKSQKEFKRKGKGYGGEDSS